MSQKNRNPSVDLSRSSPNGGHRQSPPDAARPNDGQLVNGQSKAEVVAFADDRRPPASDGSEAGAASSPLPAPVPRPPVSLPDSLSSSTEELVLSLNEHLLYLYENGQLCDVFLITADGTRFGMHRVVLASCSEQYRQQLLDDPATAPTDIPLHSVSPEILDGVIRFMYTGQLRMTEGNVQEVMSAAQQLGLPRLLEHARGQLLDRYDAANVLRYVPLVQRHDMPDLKTDMLSFAGRQFAAVSQSPDFLRLDPVDLRALLSDERSRDDGRVPEVELLRAAVRWLRAADIAVRHEQAVPVLECVRLQLVSPNDLLEVLERGSPGLADIPEVSAMLCRAYRHHAINGFNAGAGAGARAETQ